METKVYPEREEFTVSDVCAIIALMKSIEGNAYSCLVDIKADLIAMEKYTMLAQLRNLEEAHDCPIMYKYSV
jgi:hypothetical protein